MKVASSSSPVLDLIKSDPFKEEFEIKEKKPWLGFLGWKPETVLVSKTGLCSLYGNFKAYFFSGYVKEARQEAAKNICKEIKGKYSKELETSFKKQYLGLEDSNNSQVASIDALFNKAVAEKGITVCFVKNFLNKLSSTKKTSVAENKIEEQTDSRNTSKSSIGFKDGSINSTDFIIGSFVDIPNPYSQKERSTSNEYLVSISKKITSQLEQESGKFKNLFDQATLKIKNNQNLNRILEFDNAIDEEKFLIENLSTNLVTDVTESEDVNIPGAIYGTITVKPLEITIFTFVNAKPDKIKDILEQADRYNNSLAPDSLSCVISQGGSNDKNLKSDTATYKFKKLPELTLERKFESSSDGFTLSWRGQNKLLHEHAGIVSVFSCKKFKGSLISYKTILTPSVSLNSMLLTLDLKKKFQDKAKMTSEKTVKMLKKLAEESENF